MFFTEAKFRRSVIELGEKRYFGHTCIAPFTAMEGQLSQDESNVSIPEKILTKKISLKLFLKTLWHSGQI